MGGVARFGLTRRETVNTAQSFRYFWVVILSVIVLTISVGAWADHKPGHGGNGGGKPGDGSGSDSGDDIKLSCLFDDANGENVTDDNRSPATYDDGDRNVACSTGGTSQPNLSGISLSTIASGRKVRRQVDLAFESCSKADDDSRCMLETEMDALVDALPEGMNGIFSAGSGALIDPDNYDMENIRFAVRPYRDVDLGDDKDHGGDHLQNLIPGDYAMAVRFSLIGSPRVVINLAAHDVPDDKAQGVLCNLGNNSAALAEDANVTVHGEEDHPLLYSVDTGGGYQLAAICSNIPEGICGKGARASDLCTFHGLVKVKLNFMAFELP